MSESVSAQGMSRKSVAQGGLVTGAQPGLPSGSVVVSKDPLMVLVLKRRGATSVGHGHPDGWGGALPNLGCRAVAW